MIDKQHKIDKYRPHIQSVEGRYGECSYFRNDEYVGKSVFQYGEFSPDECEYIVQLANENPGLVLDIGANIGCVSQALLAAGHSVVAFEPQPAVHELLVMNCPKALCLNVALGASNGTTRMPLLDYSAKGNFGGISVGAGTLNIPMVTLDSYCYENVGLIKIDVEGYEEEVLRGAAETITRCKPRIYLEADRPEKLTSLAMYLASIGYRYSRHEPLLFRPDNYFGNTKRAWSRNYISANWDCECIC